MFSYSRDELALTPMMYLPHSQEIIANECKYRLPEPMVFADDQTNDSPKMFVPRHHRRPKCHKWPNLLWGNLPQQM